MANEPFKSTSYTVDRITNALASDIDGNLILKDIPNPEGVTLSELIRGLIASNVSFNSSGTFFTGANTVQDALEQLNQFAYLNNTGRFIIVDPTISDELTISGQIYNDLYSAVVFSNTLLINGYNTVNVLLMGSHQPDPENELSSDLGVFEFDNTSITEIPLIKNGLKIIGVGNPTIRFKNINTEKSLFVVGSNTSQEVSIRIQDISFEYINCQNVSAIEVVNCPNNTNLKDKSGLFIDGISVSFINGTNVGNKVIDFVNTTSAIKSNIKINNFSMGSIANVTPSADEIKLININHNSNSVVNIENMEFVNLDQPNPVDNIAAGNVTSLTALYVTNGKVFVNNAKLDEKMYWNNNAFSSVKTLFVNAKNNSEIFLNNVSILRDSFNTTEENAGGITTLNDWINYEPSVKINAQGGFDEIFNINVVPIKSNTPSPSGIPSTGSATTGSTGTPTTGSETTGSTGTPTTGSGYLDDIKPVKGFYNGDNLAFGIGNKNEIRLGIVDNDDIDNFSTYNTNIYGIPFAINTNDKKLYYAIDGYVYKIGNFTYNFNVKQSHWVFNGSNYEFTVPHNLSLDNKYAFNINAFNNDDEKIELLKVKAIDKNNCKIFMASDDPIIVTVFN